MILSKTDLLVTLELIHNCLGISSQSDLESMFIKLQKHVGIDSLLLGNNTSYGQSNINSPNVSFFGIAREWLQIYQQRQYALIDPVVKISFEKQSIVRWSDAYKKASDIPDDFFSLANDFGLAEGIALANVSHKTNGAAAISSVGFNGQPASKQQVVMLHQILPHLNEAQVRPSIWYTHELTDKELEVLKWAEQGKSYWDTGQIMKISERTVKFHLQNAYRKLDVVNRSQAVARALSLGFL
ncbi:MAG: LuxR family transcriptional regulator [Gammaproteobacteria bacterium]|nr:LuxR family transcriptional regulator [Gammaproteobacteria bacterium]